MIILFVFIELIEIYLILLFLPNKKDELTRLIASSFIISLYLSEISLIINGIFHKIHLFSYLTIKILLVLSLIIYLFSRRKGNPIPINRQISQKTQVVFGSPLNITIIFFFFLISLASLTRLPLKWDSYSYHLPVTANFIKKGILSSYLYYGVPIGSYYPHSIELLYSPFLSFFGIEGSSLINLPSIIMLFLFFYLISSKVLHLDPKRAKIGSLVFILLPLLSDYYYEAYVDLYFLAFCLGAFYFLKNHRPGESLNLLLFCLSLSLAIGTKTQGLSIAIIFSLLLIKEILSSKRNLTPYLKISPIIIFILSSGLFFYFRNFLLTKNPLFPLKINFLGIISFPGIYDLNVITYNTGLFFNFKRVSGEILPILIQELSVGLILIGSIWITGLLLLLSKIKNSALDLREVFGLTAFFFFLYLFTPYTAIDTGGGPNFSLRLGLIFFGFFFLTTIKMSSLFDKNIFYGLFLMTIIILFLGRLKIYPLSIIIIGVGLTLILTLLIHFFPLSFRQVFLFLVIFLGLIIPKPKMEWFNYFSDQKKLLTANIAYAGSNRHFQLYDKYIKYNLFYIRVNKDQNDPHWTPEDWQYHKYRGNLLIWLNNLKKMKIDYFVLFNKEQKFIEARWIQKYKSIFSREIRNIYYLKKEELENLITKLSFEAEN